MSGCRVLPARRYARACFAARAMFACPISLQAHRSMRTPPVVGSMKWPSRPARSKTEFMIGFESRRSAIDAGSWLLIGGVQLSALLGCSTVTRSCYSREQAMVLRRIVDLATEERRARSDADLRSAPHVRVSSPRRRRGRGMASAPTGRVAGHCERVEARALAGHSVEVRAGLPWASAAVQSPPSR
jgi:hypothetical protein